MSKSIWNDPRITAYVLDELPDQQRQAFELELESNRELAAAVEEAGSVTGQLAALYAAESTPPLDRDRRAAILAPGRSNANDPATDTGHDSADTGLNRQPVSISSWKTWSAVLATAATLVLLIGIAPWLNRHEPELTSNAPINPADRWDQPDRLDDQVAATQQEGLVSQLTPQIIIESEEEPQVALVIDENGQPSQLGLAVQAEQLSEFRLADATVESLKQTQLPGLSESDRSEILERLNKATPDQASATGQKRLNESLSTPAPVAPQRPVSPSSAAPAPTSTPIASGATSGPAPLGSAKPQPTARGLARGDGNDTSLRYQQEATREMTFETTPRSRRAVVAGGRELRQLSEQAADANHNQDFIADDGKNDVDGLAAVAEVRLGVEAKLGNRPARRPELIGEVERELQTDFAAPIEEGRGPGISGDRFEPITDNPFKRVTEHALSTFSVDVDTASYSKVRDVLLRAGHLPRPDAVRIEELVNYFDYDYQPPADDAAHPFAVAAKITSCPWNEEHRLARISLKGKQLSKGQRPPCNLVFLLDTSGSMDAPNKLPLVIEGMRMLVEQLRKKDRVAITVYAGSAGLVLDSVSAKKTNKIDAALAQLSSGGSTNGGEGIKLAYQTARDHFIADGVNRVILCTDGDFNVGLTGTDSLVQLVEQEAQGGIFLTVLGFGMGNHNDAMLEQVSGRGNGNYAFIDTRHEARKVLVDQTSGTLVTIAKNVKMQVEFNPTQVSSYRLIGYENRVLAKEDFNDDSKDAGEIGAGHTVTAFYELVPSGSEPAAVAPQVDPLTFQSERQLTEAAKGNHTMILKLRYLAPDAVVQRGDESTLVEFPITDNEEAFADADSEFRFAAAVAGFGMKLRRSPYAGDWTMSDVLQVAQSAGGQDKYELRAEFVDLVGKASELLGQQ